MGERVRIRWRFQPATSYRKNAAAKRSIPLNAGSQYGPGTSSPERPQVKDSGSGPASSQARPVTADSVDVCGTRRYPTSRLTEPIVPVSGRTTSHRRSYGLHDPWTAFLPGSGHGLWWRVSSRNSARQTIQIQLPDRYCRVPAPAPAGDTNDNRRCRPPRQGLPCRKSVVLRVVRSRWEEFPVQTNNARQTSLTTPPRLGSPNPSSRPPLSRAR